jgi:high-affinity iron transporter
LLLVSSPRAWATTTQTVQTTWKLIDYVGVDYDGAVDHGRVRSESEYAEMQEFAKTIATQIGSLPPSAAKPSLEARAGELEQLIARKAPTEQVASKAHVLSAELLAAYPIPTAPRSTPDLQRGAQLFGVFCTTCHGVAGDGHGISAAGLATPPVAFTDTERARKRSLAALEQVITQGIGDTAMPAFSNLPLEDRWALAFHAGHFAFPAAEAERGEKLWRESPDLREQVPDLQTLATTTPAALGAKIGQSKADAVMAYLRTHPEQVVDAKGPAASLATVKRKLSQSLSAYGQGDTAGAKREALSAYLDGFEPIEPLLRVRDPELTGTIETRMGEFRAAIDEQATPDVLATRANALNALLDDAGDKLSSGASSGTPTFLGAFAILLREGLEALLIIVAMLAFLHKAERRDALVHVHRGWVAALLAGVATWLVATYAISISGASRELTEGLGSLIAASVLLSVGIWMHGKSQADRWQDYVREKLAGALDGRSGWVLFGLAFIVVYREVFETILFYAALWAQGNGAMMLAGAGSASALLAAIAWAMLRYSRKLPIGTFFRYSSWLMAILTVVLAGKGVAALQEAGWIGIAPLGSIRLPIVGLFPTFQSLATQVVVVLALILGFAATRAPRSRLL